MSKMTPKYRLALDIGTTSIGWAAFRLNDENKPTAIIRAGVRIFGDGRNPEDGASLAVARRQARQMRRRRDRLLKRKQRMLEALVRFGFMPADATARRSLADMNPYQLRAEGLTRELMPHEFGRAVFHLNQRRGFKSNRKTDAKDNESGALKKAIGDLRKQLAGVDGGAGFATVGALLWSRAKDGGMVRARYRETKVVKDDGKTRTDKSYDLYIDRGMIAEEFDLLWSTQAKFNSGLYSEEARHYIRDTLLHQRKLLPVKPGRCTLLPDQERAPLALPSAQIFRIVQEVNNLRVEQMDEDGVIGSPRELDQSERKTLITALNSSEKVTFTKAKKLLKLPEAVAFNLESENRQFLKGNAVNHSFKKAGVDMAWWAGLERVQQDALVTLLLSVESELELLELLKTRFAVKEEQGEVLSGVGLPDGHSSLCLEAISRVLPYLERDGVTFDKAALAAGFESHSQVDSDQRLTLLPYYGEYLSRHTGFGTGNPSDSPEKRFGKIANPTVHIGLNQIRAVVNDLIGQYGPPQQIVVELARDLKSSKDQKREYQRQQAENTKRNERLRELAAELLGKPKDLVKRDDIQRLILWEELSTDPLQRMCPYTGLIISAGMVFSEEIEVEHILPFARTLDDSLNNKTLSARRANRVKGNRTPWEAKEDFAGQGWSYESIQSRTERMPMAKRKRFAPDGYERWLREDKDFLARALNDTRHLSRVAKAYLGLICDPNSIWVLPGQLTALLRAKLGLNSILGRDGEKNRDDHRHHAVDACVIGITDRALLQSVSRASEASWEAKGRLIERMPTPWTTYREHVQRAIGAIVVSHRPDHGYQAGFMEDTAYGQRGAGASRQWVTKGIGGANPNERAMNALIGISHRPQGAHRAPSQDGHDGRYKGYLGGSNYCIDIVADAKGGWAGEVVSTFKAYQFVREQGEGALYSAKVAVSGKPLILRLVIGDMLKADFGKGPEFVRLQKIASTGQMHFCSHIEANADARNRLDKKIEPFTFYSSNPGPLKKRLISVSRISPSGRINEKRLKGNFNVGASS
jgi:CRISPR-associated endonuclease Csn1